MHRGDLRLHRPADTLRPSAAAPITNPSCRRRLSALCEGIMRPLPRVMADVTHPRIARPAQQAWPVRDKDSSAGDACQNASFRPDIVAWQYIHPFDQAKHCNFDCYWDTHEVDGSGSLVVGHCESADGSKKRKLVCGKSRTLLWVQRRTGEEYKGRVCCFFVVK